MGAARASKRPLLRCETEIKADAREAESGHEFEMPGSGSSSSNVGILSGAEKRNICHQKAVERCDRAKCMAVMYLSKSLYIGVKVHSQLTPRRVLLCCLRWECPASWLSRVHPAIVFRPRAYLALPPPFAEYVAPAITTTPLCVPSCACP